MQKRLSQIALLFVLLFNYGCEEKYQQVNINSFSPTTKEQFSHLSFDQRALRVLNDQEDPHLDFDYIVDHYQFKTTDGLLKLQDFILSAKSSLLSKEDRLKLFWSFVEQAEKRSISLSKFYDATLDDQDFAISTKVLLTSAQNGSELPQFGSFLDEIKSDSESEFINSFARLKLESLLARIYHATYSGDLILNEKKSVIRISDDGKVDPRFMSIVDDYFKRLLSKRVYVMPWENGSFASDQISAMEWTVAAHGDRGRCDAVDYPLTRINGTDGASFGGYCNSETPSRSEMHYALQTKRERGDLLFAATVGSLIHGGYDNRGKYHKGEDSTARINYSIKGKAVIPRCDKLSICSPSVTILYRNSLDAPYYPAYPRSKSRGSRTSVSINGIKIVEGKKITVDRSKADVIVEVVLARTDSHVGVSGGPISGQDSILLEVSGVIKFQDEKVFELIKGMMPFNHFLGPKLNIGGFTDEYSSVDGLLLEYNRIPKQPYIYRGSFYGPKSKDIILTALEKNRQGSKDYRRTFYGSLILIDYLLHHSEFDYSAEERRELSDLQRVISAWGHENIAPELRKRVEMLRGITKFPLDLIDEVYGQLQAKFEAGDKDLKSDDKQLYRMLVRELDKNNPKHIDIIVKMQGLIESEKDCRELLRETIAQLNRFRGEMVASLRRLLNKEESLNTELAQFNQLTVETNKRELE